MSKTSGTTGKMPNNSIIRLDIDTENKSVVIG